MFANCLYTKTMFVHVSEGEIFTKFALECDWKSKKSQSVQNLVIFRNRFFFENFSESPHVANFFLECVSNGIFLKMSFHLVFEVFFGKNQKKIKVGKVRNYDEETEYFEKKNALILLKGIFNNVGGRKYPGGSRMSCYFSPHM